MVNLKTVSQAVQIANDVAKAAKNGIGDFNKSIDRKIKKVKCLAMTLIIINTVVVTVSLIAAGVAIFLNYKNSKKLRELEEKLLLDELYDEEEYDFSLDEHTITEFSDDEEEDEE